MITIAYIGESFYRESNTMMGNFLVINGDKYERCGLGDIAQLVSQGEELHVRPANDKEMVYAYRKLEEIRGRWK